LQGTNNAEAIFVKGMGDICSGRPGGVALLAWSEEEGKLHASYMLAVIKYNKYGTTEDVLNHIQHVYGESTSGVQVRGWSTEDGGSEEEGRCVQRVCHWVSEEIGHVMWREHINYE
jgi:hypothetical protein